MRLPTLCVCLLSAFVFCSPVDADYALLKTHCFKCHGDKTPKGGFRVRSLGSAPTNENIDLWEGSLDYVKSGEMPPAKNSRLSEPDRKRLVTFLAAKVTRYHATSTQPKRTTARRLNNREFRNSVRDVLMIEDVGTHRPTASLLGDTLHEGFDTNGDMLGLSEYHLEQYINALRKIVDATILTGDRPTTRRYTVTSDEIFMTSIKQSSRRQSTIRNGNSVDFLDIRKRAYFGNFVEAPTTGRYRIKIRAKAMDRYVYDSDDTGIYHGDPIQLQIHLGDRVKTINLADDQVTVIELDEWIAAGTRLEMTYPTDGLRQRKNGNFKFQYAIAGEHIKQTDPDRYQAVAQSLKNKTERRRSLGIERWQHWKNDWQGPRPRLLDAEIEGPIYDAWPPMRQTTLLGMNPTAANAAESLLPIAERAWRRKVGVNELDPIIQLVQSKAKQLGDIDALKEGIVAILVSPSFLIANPADTNDADLFATKFSYFLKSTTPDKQLRDDVRQGKMETFAQVCSTVDWHIKNSRADEFLREFPHSWMQLDRINFMAPDPDYYPLYNRKRISEDMVNEALHFFRHVIDNNLPVTEFLLADYSFVNADLAKVYELEGVTQDSRLRKHTFDDGRRGGLLGMGAFLTLTADSLGTSPIHRAVYVMENFMGIHPTPPPADVKITEPDIRQAKTIKEVLAAHVSDANCAACHESIDPFGYAFENFGPMGDWRDRYRDAEASKKKRLESEGILIDSSAEFRNGTKYNDIVEFRKLMTSDANQERFVRCFITKLLTYANGNAPKDYATVDKILAKSAEHDYRIIETIAAVVDSPLFRQQ